MPKTRILLADDHAVVRAGIRNALLEMPEIEVIGEVGDGPAVIAALVEMKPDCLLVDVTMPDFEPIKTIRHIRQDYPEMKIVVISAYDNDYYVQGLLRVGVNGYYLKDQPLSDLRLTVQRVLAGERWVSSRLLDRLVGQPETVAPPMPPTTRQRDILRLLQRGFDNQTIAQKMNLSVKTIENHLTRIYRQLNVQNRLEAVNYVMHHPEILGVSGQTAAEIDPGGLPANAKMIKILVVDDNASYRHQLQRIVGKVCPRAKIYEAENIVETVHLVKQLEPQLVFMDVVLGEENGIHCTQRVKAIAPLIKVILISAYPDRGFRRMGTEAGATAFLDKQDLNTTTLQHIIDDILN
ncbi:MAG: response regulator [Anaerolineales bacterium]|nr:response regulator [Anaerolineales bacterium]